MIALMLAARTMLPASTPAAPSPTAIVTASGAITAKQTSAAIKYFAGLRDLAVPDDLPLPLHGFKPWLAHDIERTEERQPEDANGKPGHTRAVYLIGRACAVRWIRQRLRRPAGEPRRGPGEARTAAGTRG